MSAPVLVVDDEAPVRQGVARQLERAGYSVSTVATIAEARERLAGGPVELVLCDINLDGESGLTLVEEIGRRYPDTAVIMVTAIDDPGVAKVALDNGAYGYVVKPFERNELLINITNGLRRRALELENREHRQRLECLVAVRTAELARSREELIQRLAAAADCKDPETASHLERMSRYSHLLAELAGLAPAEQELIRLAAPMHDIGKIGIPDAVLTKEGIYDAEDRRVMSEHPTIGYRILAGSDSELIRMAADIAYTHHEWWDGSGYPRGISGEAIPLAGRIVAIADVFDALTTRRRYKDAMPVETAYRLMLDERGRHFDPDLLDRFVAAHDRVVAINGLRAAGGARSDHREYVTR